MLDWAEPRASILRAWKTRAVRFVTTLGLRAAERGTALRAARPRAAHSGLYERFERRGAHGKKRLELIGEVAGSDVIIVDDIIDSGNTVRAHSLPRNYSRRAHPPRNSLTRPAAPCAGVPLVRRAARARRPSRLRVCDARPLLGGGLRCHRRVRRRTRRRAQPGCVRLCGSVHGRCTATRPKLGRALKCSERRAPRAVVPFPQELRVTSRPRAQV